jgi:hypothetical protein
MSWRRLISVIDVANKVLLLFSMIKSYKTVCPQLNLESIKLVRFSLVLRKIFVVPNVETFYGRNLQMFLISQIACQ